MPTITTLYLVRQSNELRTTAGINWVLDSANWGLRTHSKQNKLFISQTLILDIQDQFSIVDIVFTEQTIKPW